MNENDAGYICAKCGKDMKPVIDLIGSDAFRWHLAMHERDELHGDLERERHEFAAREHALCQEIERLRHLCGTVGGPFISCQLANKLMVAGRGEG